MGRPGAGPMRRLWRPIDSPLCCCSAPLCSGYPDCAIFVLSAHVPDGDLASRTSYAEEEGSWWGLLSSFFPASAAQIIGAFNGRPKGGLCTQSLLAVLQQRKEEQGGNGLCRRRTTFAELLRGMSHVVTSAGFPSTVLTVRSSFNVSSSSDQCSVAHALPSANECGVAPRALLVGICYTESREWKLDGSWNDIFDLRDWLLSELKWPEKALRLLDDRQSSDVQPTRENILRHFEWLLTDEGPHSPGPHAGDGRGCRLFHFCGHGADGELYPVDWETVGTITDEHLAKTVARNLSRGMTFTCILDCCESSSLFRTLYYKLQIPAEVGK